MEHKDSKKEKVNADNDEQEARQEISCFVPLNKKSGSCRSKEYDRVMVLFEEFQSQGKWKEHEHLISTLRKSSSVKADFEIVLCLEQGMAELLQKNIKIAKRKFREALILCDKSSNVLLLQGRALMFLGNAYRKEGAQKYGKAFKYLMLAQQNLSLVGPGEDRAELNYLFGALYNNVLSLCGREPKQKTRDRIEKYYEACYEFSMLDTATRVHERVQKIFPLGMANVLLDGQTEVSRSRVVPESKLKRAEDCLNHFCKFYPFDEQPVSMQTAFCKSRSDLEYRRGNFNNAQHFIEKGLEIAKTHGQNLEVMSLEQRLTMLEKSMPHIPIPCLKEDTSDLADQSELAKTEINIFSSDSE